MVYKKCNPDQPATCCLAVLATESNRGPSKSFWFQLDICHTFMNNLHDFEQCHLDRGVPKGNYNAHWQTYAKLRLRTFALTSHSNHSCYPWRDFRSWCLPHDGCAGGPALGVVLATDGCTEAARGCFGRPGSSAAPEDLSDPVGPSVSLVGWGHPGWRKHAAWKTTFLDVFFVMGMIGLWVTIASLDGGILMIL